MHVWTFNRRVFEYVTNPLRPVLVSTSAAGTPVFSAHTWYLMMKDGLVALALEDNWNVTVGVLKSVPVAGAGVSPVRRITTPVLGVML